MRHWSARQSLALFLAVFVTLGLSLSAVKASGMVAKMSTSTEMGASGDCHGCGDGDMGKAKAMSCASSVCASSIMAVLPQPLADALAEASATFSRSYALLRGRASPPDPYPPRPSFLG